MSEWVHECVNEWVSEGLSEWVSEWVSEWMNEWVSERRSELGIEWVSQMILMSLMTMVTVITFTDTSIDIMWIWVRSWYMLPKIGLYISHGKRAIMESLLYRLTTCSGCDVFSYSVLTLITQNWSLCNHPKTIPKGAPCLSPKWILIFIIQTEALPDQGNTWYISFIKRASMSKSRNGGLIQCKQYKVLVNFLLAHRPHKNLYGDHKTFAAIMGDILWWFGCWYF